MNLSKEKLNGIKELQAKAEKSYGKGSIQFGESSIESYPIISSTGSLKLDLALGVMGVPKGRIIEIYGPESGGKTTITLHMIKECQKAGGLAAFVDAEHALDPLWVAKLGGNPKEILISQPDCGEDGLSLVEDYVRSGVVDLVVVDSVAALVPRAEISGDMGDSHMGLQARLMSQALRKLTGIVSKSKCTVVFINQIRHKIGVMFGSPETTTGGNALKFYSSIRMDVRNDSDKKIDDEFGQKQKGIKVKIVKNKLAPPFITAHLTLYTDSDSHEYGFNVYDEVADIASELGIIEKRGTWYSYNEERIGQGKPTLLNYFSNNPDIFDEIYKKITDNIKESQEAIINVYNDSFNAKIAEESKEEKPPRKRVKKDEAISIEEPVEEKTEESKE